MIWLNNSYVGRRQPAATVRPLGGRLALGQAVAAERLGSPALLGFLCQSAPANSSSRAFAQAPGWNVGQHAQQPVKVYNHDPVYGRPDKLEESSPPGQLV